MKYYYEFYKRGIKPEWVAKQLRITEEQLLGILLGKYRDRYTNEQIKQVELILGV